MADLFYANARVRALEKGLLGREQLTRLVEAPSLDACYAQLSELGFSFVTDPVDGKLLREETLLSKLHGAFDEIAALTDECDDRVFKLWRYPYDCNNLKAAIKCFARKTECDGMLFDFGTVSCDEVKRAAGYNDFAAFPKYLAEGAQNAVSAFAKTGNPQLIDLILDKACYRQMLSDAEASGVAYAIKLVRAKIDLVNLVMLLRLMRMRQGEAGRLLLQEALIEGGEISHKEIMEYYGMTERSFWEKLYYTDHNSLAKYVSSRDPSLTEVERAADNVWMALVREAVFVAHGAEILIGYLIGVEYEVKNLRVILAGKATGLSSETVWERIRDSYV